MMPKCVSPTQSADKRRASVVVPSHTYTVRPASIVSRLVVVLRATSGTPMGMGGNVSHSTGVIIARLGLWCFRDKSVLRIHSSSDGCSVSLVGPPAPLLGEEKGPEDAPPPPAPAGYSVCGEVDTRWDPPKHIVGLHLRRPSGVPTAEQCDAPERTRACHNATRALCT